MNELTLPPGAPDPDPEAERTRLLARADRLRRRLLTAVSILDRRRHDLFDVKGQIRRHKTALLVAGGVVVVVVAIALRPRRQPTRLEDLRTRGAALRRAWQHPERVASTRPTTSLWSEIGRKALLAVVGAAVLGPLQRQIQAALVKGKTSR